MPFFDTVQRASWLGVEFPVDKIEVQGASRLALHEYPHADGANLEPLGRKPYIIRMHMVFDENIISYPGNYPDALNTIRSYAEEGESGELVIPNLGTMKAFCPQWNQVWTSQIRSGENADYEFIEDQAVDSVADTFFTGVTSTRAMEERYNTLSAMLAAGTASQVPVSTWQTLDNAFSALMQARDSVNLGSALITAKIESVTQQITAIDKLITTPLAWDVVEALKRLWQSVYDYKQNISQKILPPSTFTVPRLMSATDISRALFRDTVHAIDILQWNAVADAYAIPAGTPIRYLPA